MKTSFRLLSVISLLMVRILTWVLNIFPQKSSSYDFAVEKNLREQLYSDQVSSARINHESCRERVLMAVWWSDSMEKSTRFIPTNTSAVRSQSQQLIKLTEIMRSAACVTWPKSIGAGKRLYSTRSLPFVQKGNTFLMSVLGFIFSSYDSEIKNDLNNQLYKQFAYRGLWRQFVGFYFGMRCNLRRMLTMWLYVMHILKEVPRSGTSFYLFVCPNINKVVKELVAMPFNGFSFSTGKDY